jgi:lipoprotein-anchoring transpeptidase ErfK/SrfK
MVKPKAVPKPVVRRVITLPAGVRVAGVRVGRLDPKVAEQKVAKAFAKPLTVVIGKLRLRVDPAKLATPYITGAVGRARGAAPGTNVSLVVNPKGAAIRAWAKKVARRYDRAPAKTSLRLIDGRPYVPPRAVGRRLDQPELVRRLVRALTGNTRLPVKAAVQTVQPKWLANGFGSVIVINRDTNVLSLYKKGTKPWRTFRVATGLSSYPTPRGRFQIVVKWKHPWWYPPSSPWAEGLEPVPPGPSNPLGTRWMGLTAPGVGIHGTPQPQSIGYSASHGCIRMYVPSAEWLFEHVDVGTTVFIV